jgi:hypothetical protein
MTASFGADHVATKPQCLLRATVFDAVSLHDLGLQ